MKNVRTYKIEKTGQLLSTKDGKTFWSNYKCENPFDGWVVMKQPEFEKKLNNGEIIEIK